MYVVQQCIPCGRTSVSVGMLAKFRVQPRYEQSVDKVEDYQMPQCEWLALTVNTVSIRYVSGCVHNG